MNARAIENLAGFEAEIRYYDKLVGRSENLGDVV